MWCQKNVFLKKALLFLLLTLLALPPFFDGGRNVYIQSASSVLISLFIFLFLILPENYKVSFRGRYRWPFLFLFLYFIAALIASFFSVSPYRSFVWWLINAGYAALFYVVSRMIIKKSEAEFIVKFSILAASILSLLGLYFYFTGSYARLTSTFFWPNPFAGFLLFILPASFYFLLKEKKIWWICAVLILIPSFIFTGSRGAFLSIAAVFLIYLIWGKKNRENWRIILFVVSASFILTFSLSFLKTGNFSYLDRGKIEEGDIFDSSSSIKLNYWRGAWDIFKDNVFFGSGPATFYIVYPAYQRDAVSAGKYAHNFILETLAESGLPALIFLCLFFTALVANKFSEWKNDSFKMALFLGAAGSIIHNAADMDWHFGANSLFFWVILGLFYNPTAAAPKNNFETEIADTKFKLMFRPVIFLIAFFIFGSGIIFLSAEYNYKKSMIYRDAGNLSAANDRCFKSVFLNPNPDYLRFCGATLYLSALNSAGGEKDEYLDKASRISEELIKRDDNLSLNHELDAKIHMAKGQLKEAENEIKKAIALDKFNYPRYYSDLAYLLIASNEVAEAKNAILFIISRYSDKIVENRRAIIMEGQTITSSIEKDISNLYFFLGVISLREGEKSEAKNYYVKALNFYPGNVQAVEALRILGD